MRQPAEERTLDGRSQYGMSHAQSHEVVTALSRNTQPIRRHCMSNRDCVLPGAASLATDAVSPASSSNCCVAQRRRLFLQIGVSSEPTIFRMPCPYDTEHTCQAVTRQLSIARWRYYESPTKICSAGIGLRLLCCIWSFYVLPFPLIYYL